LQRLVCAVDLGEMPARRPGERRITLGDELRQVGRVGQRRAGSAEHHKQNDKERFSHEHLKSADTRSNAGRQRQR
jgi:hypothetical protein